MLTALRHLLGAPLDGSSIAPLNAGILRATPIAPSADRDHELDNQASQPRDELTRFLAAVEPMARGAADSLTAAVLVGFEASCIGFAFAGGYRAALGSLVPSLGPFPRASFCASEKGGAHPRVIATRLLATAAATDDGDVGRANAETDTRDASRQQGSQHQVSPQQGVHPQQGARLQQDFFLTGTKTFATLVSEADVMLVVASVGTKQDRNDLRLVRVPTARGGVTIVRQPALPFTPEVGHGIVTLDSVPIAAGEVLAGDGYTDYLKPFRTIEDLHVLAALVAHAVRMARASSWDAATVEALLVPLAAAHALAQAPPDAPETHVALGALFANVRARLDAIRPDEWARCDGDVRARWERDRPLLDVAEAVRAQRLAAARAAITARASGAHRSSPPK